MSPPGPEFPELSDWNGLLSTPGAVRSVTFGSFTVSDADAADGSGCTGITLTNNSSSQTAEWEATFDNGGNLKGYTYTSVSPGTTIPGIPSEQLNNTFQAVLEDGSSMISGLVGNWDGTTLPNGNVPCINVGGVGGT